MTSYVISYRVLPPSIKNIVKAPSPFILAAS